MPRKAKPSYAKAKFYEKARLWFSVKGKTRIEGFERLKFRKRGAFLEIRVGKNLIRAPWVLGEKALFVFREKEGGRIIIVSRKLERFEDQTKISIIAYHSMPYGNWLIPKVFAKAHATYIPKYKAVVTSAFGWFGSDRRHAELELAPSWLKGKGFGLFLDALRHIELAKLGARKWYTQIIPVKESLDFAELRGFRELDEKEAKFIKENFATSLSLNEIKKYWRVKELVPLKKQKK